MTLVAACKQLASLIIIGLLSSSIPISPGLAQSSQPIVSQINASSKDGASDSDKEGADTQMIDPTAQDKRSDQEISERINGIFSEIDGLEKVKVETKEGVVQLSGEVGDLKDSTRAQNIASRVVGVATVENKISLTREANVAPILQRLSKRILNVFNILPTLLLAGIVVYIFWFLGGKLSHSRKLWETVATNPFLAELLGATSKLSLTLIGFLLAFDILGATSLSNAILGSAGVIGIAIGFAVKDTVSNYVSSLMLSIRQPFRAKDHVVIGDREGTVVRLSSRATILMTPDGNHLRIPNSTVYQAEILNYTRNPERRFDFTISIDPGSDPETAMKIGLERLAKFDFLLSDPAPSARIQDATESAVNIRFLCWINQTETDWHKARSATFRAVYVLLQQHGFKIPDPAYRLRFDKETTLKFDGPLAKSGKLRSKKITHDDDENVDVKADHNIKEKVAEERAAHVEHDLLDDKRPEE